MDPSLSVIITTRDRAPLLERAVRSLLDGRLLPDEILVVDNASSDGTPALIGRLVQESGGRVRPLHQPRVGYAEARNTGLEAASGDLIAFMDDDCACAPDWVEQIQHAHRDNPAAVAIGGRTLNRGGGVAQHAGYLYGVFATLQGMLTEPGDRLPWLSPRRLERVLAAPRRVTALSTQNIAFKAAAVASRRFDPEAGVNEDLDFCWQLYRRHPDGLLYWPGMVCRHQYRPTVATFLAQHHRYGQSIRQAKRLFARKGILPAHRRPVGHHRTAAAYLAFAASQALAAPGSAGDRAWLLCLLLAREAAFVAGYARTALQEQQRQARDRATAFGPLHLGAAGPLQGPSFAVHMLAKRLRHGRDLFGRVEVETRTECNLACAHCPVGQGPRPPAVMETETFIRVVDQLAEVGFGGVLSPHFYNEPLLDDRLEELLAHARRRLPACSIALFTNGLLLDGARHRALRAAGVDLFVVSQHGEALPGPVRRLLSSLPAGERQRIQVEDLLAPDARLFNRGGRVRGRNMRPFSRCFMPSHFLTIDAHGDVLLCCNDYGSRHVFGNVRERPLMEIWDDPAYQEVRRRIRRGQLDLPLCRVCARGEEATPGASDGGPPPDTSG